MKATLMAAAIFLTSGCVHSAQEYRDNIEAFGRVTSIAYCRDLQSNDWGRVTVRVELRNRGSSTVAIVRPLVAGVHEFLAVTGHDGRVRLSRRSHHPLGFPEVADPPPAKSQVLELRPGAIHEIEVPVTLDLTRSTPPSEDDLPDGAVTLKLFVNLFSGPPDWLSAWRAVAPANMTVATGTVSVVVKFDLERPTDPDLCR